MEVDYLYYWSYVLFITIIVILLVFILKQRKQFSSRLIKDEEMLLEMTNKCSFYMDEYNSLRNSIHNENVATATKEGKMFSGKTALIGDYFLPSYSNTKKVLEELGFDVDIAKNSKDVINKIKYGEKYDIIFSNNIYKDGTGPECLKELKAIKGFSTPVVIHTVTKDERDYFVNEVGFDDYIEKPITIDNITPVLEKILVNK